LVLVEHDIKFNRNKLKTVDKGNGGRQERALFGLEKYWCLEQN